MPPAGVSQKKLQSERTVARILEAATRLFVTSGYHGTSIADIAREIGLTGYVLQRTQEFVDKESL